MDQGSPLTVQFGQHVISDGDEITAAEAQAPLTVSWPANPNQLYTLVMVDHNGPEAPFLHSLIIDIPGNKVEQGLVDMPYLPPRPPSSGQDHEYEIFVLAQGLGPRTGRERIRHVMHRVRHYFRLSEFSERHNLHKVGSLFFYVGH